MAATLAKIPLLHLSRGSWGYAIPRDKIALVVRCGELSGARIYLCGSLDDDDGLTVDQSYDEIVRQLEAA